MLSGNVGHRAAIAGRYWQAAHLILTNQSKDLEYFEPVGLLQGFSAELCLKCILEYDGVSSRELLDVKLRHDLSQLALLMLKRNLHIPFFVADTLLEMTPSHSKYFFRYGARNHDMSSTAFVIGLFDERRAQVAVGYLNGAISNTTTFFDKLALLADYQPIISEIQESPFISLADFQALKEKHDNWQQKIGASC